MASTGGGDVTVHQGQASGSTARLTGTVEYSLVRPNFTVTGTGVSLDCRLPTGNCGLNATLDVPPDTAVDLTSGGGNMQVSGIQGDVTLDSAGGDVTLSGIGGTADVSTGGGNLNAGDLGGILNFTTGGGDVDGQRPVLAARQPRTPAAGTSPWCSPRCRTYLNITSSGGDITIVLPHGRPPVRTSRARPSGGDYSASVPTNDASRHTIKVDSGGGNVSIAEAS